MHRGGVRDDHKERRNTSQRRRNHHSPHRAARTHSLTQKAKRAHLAAAVCFSWYAAACRRQLYSIVCDGEKNQRRRRYQSG